MHAYTRGRLTLFLFSILTVFAAMPAEAGVGLEGSDIRDPADPIVSPKTYADTLGTGAVVSVAGDRIPIDQRVPAIVEPEVPVDAPGADVRIDLD